MLFLLLPVSALWLPCLELLKATLNQPNGERQADGHDKTDGKGNQELHEGVGARGGCVVRPRVEKNERGACDHEPFAQNRIGRADLMNGYSQGEREDQRD